MERCANEDRRPEPLGHPIAVRQKDPVPEYKAKEREQRHNPDPEALRAQSCVAERRPMLCTMVHRERVGAKGNLWRLCCQHGDKQMKVGNIAILFAIKGTCVLCVVLCVVTHVERMVVACAS